MGSGSNIMIRASFAFALLLTSTVQTANFQSNLETFTCNVAPI